MFNSKTSKARYSVIDSDPEFDDPLTNNQDRRVTRPISFYTCVRSFRARGFKQPTEVMRMVNVEDF
jgi:hypothetical protein